MVHFIEDQVDGPRSLSDGPDRSQDSVAGGAGALGGVLDAAVKFNEGELGCHGRDRHYGGKAAVWCISRLSF